MTIYIHKGDDTIFGPQDKFLTFIFDTDLDLTGWRAQFKLGGFTKVIEDITSKEFDITISHNTTTQLPLGKLNGSIVLVDNNNRIKTVINTLPFVITKDVIEQQYETIDLTIPKSSGVDIKMRIGGRAVYSVNGKTGEVILTAEDIGAIPEDYINNLATYEYVDASIANTQAELDNTNARLNQKADIDYVNEELDLKADKTEVARKANISDIPTRVSQLVNDEGYITEHQDISGKADIDYVDEALGYKADKSDTYTKVEVDTIVDELILESSAVTSVNGMIGEVVIDIPSLEGYVKNTDYATNSVAGVVKPTSYYGLSMATGGYLTGMTISQTDWDRANDKALISKATFNNVRDDYVKRGLIENTIELTDDEKTSVRTWLGAVGNTDYVTGSKAGIITVGAHYGTQILNTQGLIGASVRNLSQYTDASTSLIIGKGTLENVLTQYSKTVLTTQADYDALETKDANTLYLIEE